MGHKDVTGPGEDVGESGRRCEVQHCIVPLNQWALQVDHDYAVHTPESSHF
jgi:hypothetical protein